MPKSLDPAVEVEKALKWAMALRKRSTVYGGKASPTATPYPDQKIVDIAYRALVYRQISKLPDFKLALQFFLNQYNLPNPTHLK